MVLKDIDDSDTNSAHLHILRKTRRKSFESLKAQRHIGLLRKRTLSLPLIVLNTVKLRQSAARQKSLQSFRSFQGAPLCENVELCTLRQKYYYRKTRRRSGNRHSSIRYSKKNAATLSATLPASCTNAAATSSSITLNHLSGIIGSSSSSSNSSSSNNNSWNYVDNIKMLLPEITTAATAISSNNNGSYSYSSSNNISNNYIRNNKLNNKLNNNSSSNIISNKNIPQQNVRLCARKRRQRRRRKRKLYPDTNNNSSSRATLSAAATRTTTTFSKLLEEATTPTTAVLTHYEPQFKTHNMPVVATDDSSSNSNSNNTISATYLHTATTALVATTKAATFHNCSSSNSNITTNTTTTLNSSPTFVKMLPIICAATFRLLLTTLATLVVIGAERLSTIATHMVDVAIGAVTTALPTTRLQQQQQYFWRCSSSYSSSNSRLPFSSVLNKYSWIFLLIYLNLSAKVCLAGYHEKRLLHDLLDPYNTLERPVLNESDPLQLSFGLTLMQIIDVDEKNQLLVTNVWLKLEWNDMNLRWNTTDYGGVKDLRIPPHRIWKPDVLMYNSADEGFDGTYQTNVVVRNNGSCLYVPPGIFKSTCKIDITWFPFDDQRCEMKFGSWTYDGFQLDLQLQDETGGDISSYVLNGEWELLGVPGKRNEIYYNCCPEPYIDITFAIIIRRRTLYYFFNLIIPCVLIASMALLGFTLPPDSGEKLSLGVTILLSLTVFLNMVAETMPATSDAVPLLGTYFNCIMFMVASSVVSTILILNYHHRNADTHEMSEWVRVVFLCWLPWILRMSRPGRPLILEFPTTPCSDTSSERKHQILSDVELKERSSKSLLANVLDIDDDFRHNCRPMTPGGTLPHNPAFYRTVYGQGDDGSIGPIGSTRMPDAVTHHASCIKSSTEYELGLILKEIRFITDQLRKEDEDNDVANDWKFAAMVVDRLCLIIFTLFTILATIAVLLSAPHIIVS